jgi:hypothetical protein
VTVCFNCGAMKVGAYKLCDACNVAPRKTADHVYSLMLTDHYFPREELARISRTMLSGGPRPSLPEQLLEKLGKDAARYNGTTGPLYVQKEILMDVTVATQLAQAAPLSFRKAKKMVVALASFGGSLSSRVAKLSQLEADIRALRHALETESYRPDLRCAPADLLSAYFDSFSKAFPDEQSPSRYGTLEFMIQMSFGPYAAPLSHDGAP